MSSLSPPPRFDWKAVAVLGICALFLLGLCLIGAQLVTALVDSK